MKLSCPAKINLFLKLTGKRADGYHELQSLFAFLDLQDELEVALRPSKNDQFLLEIDGEFGSLLDSKKNLFTQILDFFSAEFGVEKNLYVKITKNVPVGAGLGGGSSDAASFMIALNEIFALNLSKKDLQKISLNFGSDIAFFFEESAAIVEGRGEEIATYPQFEPIFALLINPKISLSTKEVFQKFSDKKNQKELNFSPKISTNELLQKNVFELIKDFSNDLLNPATKLLPTIDKILIELKNQGAEIAKMSGSGATCFGIFFDEKKLDEAEKNLQKKFENFFVRKTKIVSNRLAVAAKQ